jgi:hypothetical protein
VLEKCYAFVDFHSAEDNWLPHLGCRHLSKDLTALSQDICERQESLDAFMQRATPKLLPMCSDREVEAHINSSVIELLMSSDNFTGRRVDGCEHL